MTADLLLTNARILTLNPLQPLAEAVAVRGETILAVGNSDDLETISGPTTRVIDCQGQTLMPGFVDSHCHLLALASSLTGVNCGEETVPGIGDLQRIIRSQAKQTPPGEWIRGHGYDDLSFLEKRHPTRWDLDEATTQHPVRINHRSGHATVLNSRGLALAGVDQNTPDPVDGVIHRDPNTGEPTGLLFEMAGFLRKRLGPRPDQPDQSIGALNQKLLECGITSVQDAGPHNELARWTVFRDLVDSGKLLSRMTMMAGAKHLEEFTANGMGCGFGDNRLRLGHAKIMLTLTTGELNPPLPELKALVSRCHRRGFPVAIHAVEIEAVIAAATVLGDERLILDCENSAAIGDRIEHCSECPSDVLSVVKASGATVVTQPGFIYWNGDRYLIRVEPELLPNLYAIDSLRDAGVPVAFSSDAPVIDPNPWHGIYSAVTGYTRLGARLPEPEAKNLRSGTSVLEALRMYSIGGACSEGTQQVKGNIVAGKLADLILVDADPTQTDKSDLKDIKTVLTIIGGSVVWESGP